MGVPRGYTHIHEPSRCFSFTLLRIRDFISQNLTFHCGAGTEKNLSQLTILVLFTKKLSQSSQEYDFGSGVSDPEVKKALEPGIQIRKTVHLIIFFSSLCSGLEVLVPELKYGFWIHPVSRFQRSKKAAHLIIFCSLSVQDWRFSCQSTMSRSCSNLTGLPREEKKGSSSSSSFSRKVVYTFVLTNIISLIIGRTFFWTELLMVELYFFLLSSGFWAYYLFI